MNTEIINIIDRSGSTASILAESIAGFGSFIEEQRKLEGECRVTTVVFDDKIETQYEKLDVKDVPLPLDMKPRGWTALYDALGITLKTQAARIEADAWADLIIVQIITDGQENASKEYSANQIKDLITRAEAQGWKFIFQAAGQDAFVTGAAMGISAGMTRSYVATGMGTKTAYATMSADVTNLRSGLVAGDVLSDPKQFIDAGLAFPVSLKGVTGTPPGRTPSNK